jgi:hypothetical protein
VVYCFHASDTKLQKVDFSATVANGATAPTVTTIATASATTGIPDTSGSQQAMMNAAATRFDTAFGGGQNSWTTVWAYDTTSGGRWLGLNTMTVGGDWGPKGNATLFNELGTPLCSGSGCTNVGGHDYTCSSGHDMVMDQTGRWAFLQTECTGVISGIAGVWYFWDLATANVYYFEGAGATYHGGGHIAMGWDNIFLNDDSDGTGGWFMKRIVPNTASFSALFPNTGAPSDLHLNWNNQIQGQLQPVIASYFRSSAPTSFWQDEIVGSSIDGSQVAWRFAHMYTRATQFAAQGIAHASRDGKWAIFCSDWGGTARADVFIVPLK